MEVKEERIKKKSIEEEQLAKAKRLISKFNWEKREIEEKRLERVRSNLESNIYAVQQRENE